LATTSNASDLNNHQKHKLLIAIDEKFDKLSKGQKKIASFINTNYEKAVFMTAASIASEVGVSESTVVRFATTVGFKGFPDFQKALKEMVAGKLNSIQRIDSTAERIKDVKDHSQVLATVMQTDQIKIKETLDDVDVKVFEEAIKAIESARRVYIIGLRSCSPLASFLGFYLNLVCEDVNVLHYNSSSEIFEQLMHIRKEDVIIGISFPRYSMRTLKALEYANSKRAKVITITDSIHSPINLYSTCNLIAKSDMEYIVDSLVAPMSLLNALIIALFIKGGEKVKHTFTQLEEIWDEYHVYTREELDQLRIDMDD